MQKWWEKPLYAVTIELPAAKDLENIDVKRIVRKLTKNGVNVIVAFAVGYWPGGTTFYQSNIAPHHPNLKDRDLLKEIIEEAHKNGARVIGYVNVLWGDKKLYFEHPEWAQRRIDGKPTTWEENYTSVAMCPNTPYKDYIINVIKEISEKYDIDGFYFDEPSFQSWCNCSYCRELFKKQFNQELPTEEKWGDPLWQKFIQWRYEKITEFKKLLYNSVKKDDVAIFFQHPFPLAFWPEEAILFLEKIGEKVTRYVKEMVTWYIPLAYGSDLEEVSKFEDIIHMELYRKSVERPLWWYEVCIKLARAINDKKPILVLNMQGNSPFDLSSLPDDELKLAIGEIVANGGNSLFALYYPDIADPNGWKTIFNQFKELKKYEEYLINRESVKFVAILYSRKTIDFFDSSEEIKHTNELLGFCKALLQEHIPFDIVTEDNLMNKLNDYKILILPNVVFLPKEKVEVIKDFVKRGGGIIVSYRTSIYDDDKKMDNLGLSEVLGVKYLGYEKQVFTTDSYMKINNKHPIINKSLYNLLIPSFGSQLAIEALKNAQVLSTLIEESIVHYAPLGEDTNLPTIVTNEYDKGRTVYFAGPVGYKYLEYAIPYHRNLIINSIKWLSKNKLPLIAKNCPETIAIIPWYQKEKERYVIHLVNSVRDDIEFPITHVPTFYNIEIELLINTKAKYKAEQLFPEKKKLSIIKKKGRILLKIPEVKHHCIISIKKQS
ncbi:MAG: beta-galactosidase trimerization domain-containing protein [Candidatus Aenigmatarchaeota archaeon]